MAKASERASKGVGLGAAKDPAETHSVDPGPAIGAIVEPGKQALNELLERVTEENTHQEVGLDVPSKINRSPAEQMIIDTLVVVMKSHVAIMERMAGDINMAEKLKAQIAAAEEF